MKKFIFFILLIVYIGAYSQSGGQSENRFAASESTASANDGVAARGIGNPPGGEELPIDDYIPLLALTAAGLILVIHYRHRRAGQN